MAVKFKLDRLKVGNQEYILRGVSNLSDTSEGGSEPMFGQTFWWSDIIEYDTNVTTALAEETLFHEILETIKNTMCDVEWPEWQMDLIARHIVQVLHQFNVHLAVEVKDDNSDTGL